MFNEAVAIITQIYHRVLQDKGSLIFLIKMTERDNVILQRILDAKRAAKEEQHTRFGSLRVPLAPFTKEEMDRLILAIEERVVHYRARFEPTDQDVGIMAWSNSASWSNNTGTLWMTDAFQESPLGPWMKRYRDIVQSFEDSGDGKYLYAQKWMRRICRTLFQSIIEAWNAEHSIFVMKHRVEEEPFILRIEKKQ